MIPMTRRPRIRRIIHGHRLDPADYYVIASHRLPGGVVPGNAALDSDQPTRRAWAIAAWLGY